MLNYRHGANGSIPPPAKPTTDRLEARRTLHELIHTYFDADELRQLCYDLGIVYGDLGDGGHDDKILELILLVIRQSSQAQLLTRLKELRPKILWPMIE